MKPSISRKQLQEMPLRLSKNCAGEKKLKIIIADNVLQMVSFWISDNPTERLGVPKGDVHDIQKHK